MDNHGIQTSSGIYLYILRAGRSSDLKKDDEIGIGLKGHKIGAAKKAYSYHREMISNTTIDERTSQ